MLQAKYEAVSARLSQYDFASFVMLVESHPDAKELLASIGFTELFLRHIELQSQVSGVDRYELLAKYPTVDALNDPETREKLYATFTAKFPVHPRTSFAGCGRQQYHRHWSFDGLGDDESIIPRLRELIIEADANTSPLALGPLAFLAAIGYTESRLVKQGTLTWDMVASYISCFTGEPPSSILARHGVVDRHDYSMDGVNLVEVRARVQHPPVIRSFILAPIDLVRCSDVVRADYLSNAIAQCPFAFALLAGGACSDMSVGFRRLVDIRPAHLAQLSAARWLLFFTEYTRCGHSCVMETLA
jgi:hypothetical protein